VHFSHHQSGRTKKVKGEKPDLTNSRCKVTVVIVIAKLNNKRDYNYILIAYDITFFIFNLKHRITPVQSSYTVYILIL